MRLRGSFKTGRCRYLRRAGTPALPILRVGAASRRAGGSGRSAMTLIEILMAMGIFMLGVIGILTLFPVAIRNISIAVNRTIGAAVAKNAIASMRFFAIDLYWIPSGVATINATSDIELDGRFGSSFSHAVRDYHLDAIASGGTDGRYLGHGIYHDPFKIPEDVELPDVLKGDINGDGTPEYVAVPWHPDFGWTATLRPMPKDDNVPPNALADEAPAGIGAGDDPPNIDDNTAYQTQIAVWRNYALIDSAGTTGISAKGKFHPYGENQYKTPRLDTFVYITLGGAGADLWNRVKPGDYIRHKGHGVWYQIAYVQPGAVLSPYDGVTYDGQIILARAYSHPFAREAAPLEGEVQFANRFRLVALYDTVIGPEQ